MDMRTEKDFLGEMQLPADVPWGIHTARALENFPIPGSPVPSSLIRALAQVKQACARANRELGYLSPEKADAIIAACGTVGDAVCPLPALQGGAGTSTNMFMNERIAREAGKDIHPIEDVNLHQSTNDVYPTAVKVAAIQEMRCLAEKIERLQGVFQRLQPSAEPNRWRLFP